MQHVGWCYYARLFLAGGKWSCLAKILNRGYWGTAPSRETEEHFGIRGAGLSQCYGESLRLMTAHVYSTKGLG
jgi:hypothetical protein